MKSLALFVLSFLFVAALMLTIYSNEIGRAQVDFQGYSRIKNMLEGIDK